MSSRATAPSANVIGTGLAPLGALARFQAPDRSRHALTEASVGGVARVADPPGDATEPAQWSRPAPALAAVHLVKVLREPGDVVLRQPELHSHRLELGLRASRTLLPVDLLVPGEPRLPLLRDSHVSRDPGLLVADQIERAVVDRPEVGRDDLLAGR